MGLKPISEIKADLGIEPNGRAQKFFTNSCRNHMNQYVPLSLIDHLHMRENIRMGDDYITYQALYAHAQYVGIVHGTPIKDENRTTPNTCSYWDKKMVSVEINDVIKEVQDYINKNRRNK